MKTGNYDRSIDWESFETECFSPHLFIISLLECRGCGATALSLLTGISPHCFRERRNWTDKYMVKFLKDRNYDVQEITMCDVTAVSSEINSSINENHVILASQLVSKNVASWSVMHNNLWYHNFDVCNFRPTILINNPILTCYLVWHEKWTGDKNKVNL